MAEITELKTEDYFVHAWRLMAAGAYANAIEKGFYETPNEDGTRIALMHSELSEALEALRKDKLDDHLPQYHGVEAELADVVIRIMDFAEHRGLRVAEAVVDKMAYNRTRPHKHGGKKF